MLSKDVKENEGLWKLESYLVKGFMPLTKYKKTFIFYSLFFLSPLGQFDYVMKYCKFTTYDFCKIFILFLNYFSCFWSFFTNNSMFSHLVTSTLNQCEKMNVWKASWNKRSQVASPIYYHPTSNLPYISYLLFSTFHQSWLGFCFSLHF